MRRIKQEKRTKSNKIIKTLMGNIEQLVWRIGIVKTVEIQVSKNANTRPINGSFKVGLKSENAMPQSIRPMF